MLRACRRLLCRGGRLAFLTIHLAPNLSSLQHRQAVRAGPPGVRTRHEHPSLLRTAGFRDIEESDVTAEYLHSVRAWFSESAAREVQLRAVLGDVLFEDRQNDRSSQASAIRRGLLRRSLLVARVAGAATRS